MNIAGPGEKCRFYRIARRSTTETAAILLILQRRGAAPEEDLQQSRELARVVISLLVQLIKSVEKRPAQEF